MPMPTEFSKKAILLLICATVCCICLSLTAHLGRPSQIWWVPLQPWITSGWCPDPIFEEWVPRPHRRERQKQGGAGEEDESEIYFVVHQRELIHIKAPAANVIDRVVLAMVVSEMATVSNLGPTMKGIQHFQASANVFVACTEDIGVAISQTFPDVRFAIRPWLASASKATQPTLTIQLLRTALESGAKAVWYLKPDLVLFAPLPAMEPSVQIGLAPTRDSPQNLDQRGAFDPGLVYVKSMEALRTWEQEVLKRGQDGESGALEIFKGRNGTLELPCGHNVGSFEIDEGRPEVQITCSSPSSSPDSNSNSNSKSGPELKFGTCSLVSAQLSARTFEALARRFNATVCGSSSHSIFSKLPAAKPENTWDKKHGTPRAYLGSGGCLGTWCNEATNQDDAKVIHRWKAIPHTDPAARVVGHVVVCLVTSSLGGELPRLMASLQLFEANTTIFVAATREIAQLMPAKYPKMRLSMHVRLDKYRDPKGKWLGRSALSGKHLWYAFNSERPRLMKSALLLGATGAWYMDSDVVLVSPFPLLPNVQAGLTPHRAREDVETNNGHYNSGMAYFSKIERLDEWLNGRNNGNFESTAQKVLDKFKKNENFVDLPCGVNIGWYQIIKDSNPEKKDMDKEIKCINGTLFFKDCQAVTFHFHEGDFRFRLLEKSLREALAKCNNPMSYYFRGRGVPMPRSTGPGH